MALPDTTVIHSYGANVPPITILENGSLIAALRKVLVDGWGEQPLDAMTYDAGTGTVTATFLEEHTFTQYQVIEITGADQPEYNGRWRIMEEPTSHTLTFEIGEVPGGDATGTLFIRYAPAGWSLEYINETLDQAYFKPAALRGGDIGVYVIDTGPAYSGSGRADDAVVRLVYRWAGPEDYSYYTSGYMKKGGTATTNTDLALRAGDSPVWAVIADQHTAYVWQRVHNNDSHLDCNSTVFAFGYIDSIRDKVDFLSCLADDDSDDSDEASHLTPFGRAQPGSHYRLSNYTTDEFTSPSVMYLPSTPNLGMHGEGLPDTGLFRYKYPVEVYVTVGWSTSSSYENTNSSRYVGALRGVGMPLHHWSVMSTFSLINTEADGPFMYFGHFSDDPVSTAITGTEYMGGSMFKLIGPWPTGA